MESKEEDKKIVDNVSQNEKEDIKKDDIDNSIEELNRYLSELKKARQTTEKDERVLAYRKKILNYEENRAAKKIENDLIKNKNKQRIRVNMKKDKDIIEEKKKTDIKNLAKVKTKIEISKKDIENSLKNWKPNVTKKNKIDADKTKEERKEIEDFISKTKDSHNNQNKKKHDLVQFDRLQKEEQKKEDIYQKKLKMKQDLEDAIKKELKLKTTLENKITVHKKHNEELLQRLKEHNNNINSNRPKIGYEVIKTRSKTPKGNSLRIKIGNKP